MIEANISPYQNVIKNCLKVQTNESVLLVTDPKRSDLAELFALAARELTSQVELVSFDTMTENAQEPPQEIADKMANAKVCLLVTTFSLSHTKARKDACLKGSRIASMPGITKDMIERTLSVDYSKIKTLSEQLADILTMGKTVTITSASGTNLTLDITGRNGLADTGIIDKPGLISNLPAGEGFIAPLETGTNGLFIVDGIMAGLTLDKPITIEFKNGQAINVTGGMAAKQLTKQLDAVGSKARTIAELGIGTNPTATLVPEILEAEKVYGTCHVALGNSATIGGQNQVPFHSDGIIMSPVLKVDGRTILADNKIVI